MIQAPNTDNKKSIWKHRLVTGTGRVQLDLCLNLVPTSGVFSQKYTRQYKNRVEKIIQKYFTAH